MEEEKEEKQVDEVAKDKLIKETKPKGKGKESTGQAKSKAKAKAKD